MGKVQMAWVVSKEDIISLPYSVDVIFNIVPKVVSKFGWKIDHADKALNRFRVKIGMSFWTWGQTMFIDLSKIDERTTKVRVYSEAGGQTFDWGKNRRDIERFLRELESTLKH